ncbi:MAG: hypothetical protein RB191_16125 [Terriglobia bacterium]|nr:hypothetical protein [Terriglobia bacterium]
MHFGRGPASAGFARLPGVTAHELAHFLVALVTGSNPKPISLVPKRIPGGWELGSVIFTPHWASAALVALAPLYLLPPAALFLDDLAGNAGRSAQFIVGYCVATLICNAWPSSTDWNVAFKHPIGLLLIASLGWLALHLH